MILIENLNHKKILYYYILLLFQNNKFHYMANDEILYIDKI